MTKFNWRKARERDQQHKFGSDADEKRRQKLAQKLALGLAPSSRVDFTNQRQPYRQRKHAPNNADGIWIVIGADCPWNPTPGQRRVFHFATRKQADKARETSFKSC